MAHVWQGKLDDIRGIFARDRRALENALTAAQCAVRESAEAQKLANADLEAERCQVKQLERALAEQAAMFELALSDLSNKEKLLVEQVSLPECCYICVF